MQTKEMEPQVMKPIVILYYCMRISRNCLGCSTTHPMAILVGRPGLGKTTLAESECKLFAESHITAALCSYFALGWN